MLSKAIKTQFLSFDISIRLRRGHPNVLEPCAQLYALDCVVSFRLTPPLVKNDTVACCTSGTCVVSPASRIVNSLWRARRKSANLSLPFSRARCLRISVGSLDNTMDTSRDPYFSCVSPRDS